MCGLSKWSHFCRFSDQKHFLWLPCLLHATPFWFSLIWWSYYEEYKLCGFSCPQYQSKKGSIDCNCRYAFFQVKFTDIRGRYYSLTMNFVKLVNSKLNVDEISNLVSSPSCGAISLFVGTTRDNFENKQVSVLHLFTVVRDCYHTLSFTVDPGKVNKSWNKHMPVMGQSLLRGENPIPCSQLLEVSPYIKIMVPIDQCVLGDKILVLFFLWSTTHANAVNENDPLNRRVDGPQK